MSQLLSPSESLAFNGFLSSIDLGGVLDGWNTIAEAVPVPTARGKEALTKATKDLMSLEPTFGTPEPENNGRSTGSAGPNASWPSLPGDADQRRAQQSYTYGFNATRSSSRSFFHSPAPSSFRDPSQPPSQRSYSAPRSRSPTGLSTLPSSSSYFPSGPEASSQQQGQSRPSPFGASSSPAVLNHRTSSSKRILPSEDDGAAGSSGASAKRRRPSVAAQDSAVDSKAHAALHQKPMRSASSATATATAEQQEAASRPSLLSPSQKRANHIQSEQKRRANIRKGYEALCEAVPALREAIKLEEEAARIAEDEKEKGRRRKRKGKGNAAQVEESFHGVDGRAGPKSENVVLQKTIDHLEALLTERETMMQRLVKARAALAPGNPALEVSPSNMDENKVPLWEREWNGGSGWGDDAADDE